jgi:acyl carrier protein
VDADVSSRLRRCFSLVFPDLAREEIDTAAVASLASWDSLATVTLVAVIEEEFGMAIEPDELEEFISFELIRDHLLKRTGVDAS